MRRGIRGYFRHARAAAIAAVVILLAHTLCSAAEPSARPTFPAFGVSFQIPAGWESIGEAGPGQIARLAFADAVTTPAIGYLLVEIQPAQSATLEEFVRDVADSMGGAEQLDRKETSLDVEPAVRLAAKESGGQTQAAAAVVAARERRLYSVALYGDPVRHRDAMAALVDSWKWTPLRAPMDCLELRKDPLSVFGAFTMRLPAIARLFPVENPATQSCFGIYNHRQGHAEFFINLDRVGRDPSVSFEDTLKKFGDEIAVRMDLKEPLPWMNLKSAERPVALSKAVKATTPKAQELSKTPTVIYSIVFPDDETAVVITFTIHSNDDAVVMAYSQSALEMIRSIHF